jgi:phosphate-selective porin OprO/OprP
MTSRTITTLVAIALVSSATATLAGGVKYKLDDQSWIKVGGRMQLQYHSIDPQEGETTDDLLFRRFRPYIAGSIHEDWEGKFQWDFGKNEVGLKDAYWAYVGYENITIAMGNYVFPFSREFLTSSKKSQTVERTFVGDHNYGTPDRQAGIHAVGKHLDGTVSWGASLAGGAIDTDNRKLDFDSSFSLAKGDDWNEGPMLGGRVDYHPFGYQKFEQGDFKGERKLTLGTAVFIWSNDNDTLEPGRSDGSKSDVDGVTALELSGAFRQSGFSLDAQFNWFNSELKEKEISNGLYKNGETTLTQWALEGGYMVRDKVELVAAYQSQDADNYARSWNRLELGANWYIKKHDIKYQLTYRIGENKDGKDGNDVNEIFLQGQFVL